MISLLFSVLSLIVIAIVTVALINKTQQLEANRRMELTGVVNQINSVNDKNYDVELKQNDMINDLSRKLGTVVSDVNVTKATLSQMSGNVDTHTRILDTGTFKSVSVNGKSLISHDKDALQFKMGNVPIVGFDNVSGKRMLIGQSLELAENLNESVLSTGDFRPLVVRNGGGTNAAVFKDNKVAIIGDLDVGGKFTYGGKEIMGAGSDKSLIVNSGVIKQTDGDVGVRLHKDKVGVGMSPEHALDVAGDVSARGGSLFLGDKMAVHGGDELALNPGGKWKTVIMEGDAIQLGNQDKEVNLINPMGYNMDGPLNVQGDVASGQNIFGNSMTSKQLMSDKIETKDMRFAFEDKELWSVSPDPMGSLIFKNAAENGLFGVKADGSIQAKDGMFNGLITDADVQAKGKVVGSQICTGPYSCMGTDEVNYVVNAAKGGDQRLANMQSEIDRIKTVLKL